MSAGAQWRAEVKAEAARQAKARRQQRGRPRRNSLLASKLIGPGMARVTVRDDGTDGTDGDHPGPPPAA